MALIPVVTDKDDDYDISGHESLHRVDDKTLEIWMDGYKIRITSASPITCVEGDWSTDANDFDDDPDEIVDLEDDDD